MLRRRAVVWAIPGLTALAALLPTPARAQGPLPILRYDEPAGFYHSAISPPQDFSATGFNGSLQIYEFRPADADVERQFRTTLLRDWIAPQYRETNVVGVPEFRTMSLPGAQLVVTAKFYEAGFGAQKPRMRWLIVAGGAAALLDAGASSPTAWQQALPLLNAWSASLRVEFATPAPAMTPAGGAAARAFAGRYMALAYKDVADLGRGAGAMTRVLASLYYLFSPDGSVYRAYDDLPVPGGDPSRFDFAAAQRRDPVNSGRYSLEGNRLRIEMGAQGREVVTATVPGPGRFTIGRIEYTRQ